MSVIAVTAPAGIGGGSRRLWWAPPLLATSLAVLGLAVGWRGVDLPAQIYRVTLFHNEGFTLWDTGWYGGHWTLDYSVLFPPIGGMIGVGLTGVASAALAALAFDRLVIGHFGPTARVGSFAFALGTIVQLSIGQLPFLLGEALGLAACWAASRRRWGVALGLAIATSLASPLAGAFLGLAGLAWLISRWPAQRVGLGGLIAGAAVPVVILELLFPGQGFFPFPAADFVWKRSPGRRQLPGFEKRTERSKRRLPRGSEISKSATAGRGLRPIRHSFAACPTKCAVPNRP